MIRYKNIDASTRCTGVHMYAGMVGLYEYQYYSMMFMYCCTECLTVYLYDTVLVPGIGVGS